VRGLILLYAKGMAGEGRLLQLRSVNAVKPGAGSKNCVYHLVDLLAGFITGVGKKVNTQSLPRKVTHPSPLVK